MVVVIVPVMNLVLPERTALVEHAEKLLTAANMLIAIMVCKTGILAVVFSYDGKGAGGCS
jgi:hypothetical protein